MHISLLLVCLSIFNMVLSIKCLYLFIPCFGHAEKMTFYGFTDGAYCHTLNLASAAWVLYSPAEELVSSGAVCIGPATNNITEYRAVIDLLTKVASQDVRNLVVLMDSQLVVCHLNHVYTIRNPMLLCLFRGYGC